MSGPERDQVFEYVDGAMPAAERAAFEQSIRASRDLEKQVRHARVVRDLIAGLPRRAPPAAFGLDFDSILEKTKVEESAGVGKLLTALPRRIAPDGIFAAVMMRVRADRRRRTATPVVRRMASVRRVGQWAAAAVLVLGTFAILGHLSRAGAAAPRYAFDVTYIRPGTGHQSVGGNDGTPSALVWALPAVVSGSLLMPSPDSAPSSDGGGGK